MLVRGIRGATTVDTNSRDEILEATRELLGVHAGSFEKYIHGFIQTCFVTGTGNLLAVGIAAGMMCASAFRKLQMIR